MTPRSDSAISIPSEHHWQVVMAVSVAIADRAAVYDHTVIEQCFVTFLNALQPIKKMREEFAMITIDLCEVRNIAAVVAVMGETVMTSLHAKVRIASVIPVVRQQICSDARGISLERERHHVAHHTHVCAKITRFARWRFEAFWQFHG